MKYRKKSYQFSRIALSYNTPFIRSRSMHILVKKCIKWAFWSHFEQKRRLLALKSQNSSKILEVVHYLKLWVFVQKIRYMARSIGCCFYFLKTKETNRNFWSKACIRFDFRNCQKFAKIEKNRKKKLDCNNFMLVFMCLLCAYHARKY